MESQMVQNSRNKIGLKVIFDVRRSRTVGNCSSFSDLAADRCCTCQAVEGLISTLMFSMPPSFSAEFRHNRLVLFAPVLKSSFVSS